MLGISLIKMSFPGQLVVSEEKERKKGGCESAPASREHLANFSPYSVYCAFARVRYEFYQFYWDVYRPKKYELGGTSTQLTDPVGLMLLLLPSLLLTRRDERESEH